MYQNYLELECHKYDELSLHSVQLSCNVHIWKHSQTIWGYISLQLLHIYLTTYFQDNYLFSFSLSSISLTSRKCKDIFTSKSATLYICNTRGVFNFNHLCFFSSIDALFQLFQKMLSFLFWYSHWLSIYFL